LARVIFPLGGLKKPEVRKIAKKVGLPNADKKDSVGICFVGDIDVQKFLRRRLEEESGEVVDVKGEVIGTHKGVWFYTIGERGGWEIKPEYQKKFGGAAPIMYVVDKDAKRNRLVVGFGAETYKERFMVKNLSWVNEDPDLEGVKVRIRHGGRLIPVKVVKEKKNLRLELLEPERGIASGQIAVFYKNGECLGGGVIA
jgi:tRNA-specific 2-thiouridylase